MRLRHKHPHSEERLDTVFGITTALLHPWRWGVGRAVWNRSTLSRRFQINCFFHLWTCQFSSRGYVPVTVVAICTCIHMYHKFWLMCLSMTYALTTQSLNKHIALRIAIGCICPFFARKHNHAPESSFIRIGNTCIVIAKLQASIFTSWD